MVKLIIEKTGDLGWDWHVSDFEVDPDGLPVIESQDYHPTRAAALKDFRRVKAAIIALEDADGEAP